MSVKFKGFTFKKVSDLQTLKPENALSSVSASAASNVSNLDQSRKIQTSISSFTLTTPHKPVATVPPQGQRNQLSGTPEEKAYKADPASANRAKRMKEEGSETSLKDSNSPLDFIVDDDDDDFDMPTLAPITPRSQRKRNKENSRDSDDEIVPMHQHRRIVLSSDEDDADIPLEGNNLPPQRRDLVSTEDSIQLSGCRDNKITQNAFAQQEQSFCSSTPKILLQPQSFSPRSTIAKKMIKTPSGRPVVRSGLKADAAQQGTLLHEEASVTANRCVTASQQGETSLVTSMSSSRTITKFQHQSLPAFGAKIPSPCSGSLDGDILKHPLLAADVSQMTKEHHAELQQLLLRAADEVCEIICTASTAAIINLGVCDYGRLQALLAVRKQIKDKQSTITPSVPGSPASGACCSAPNCSSNTLPRNVMEAGPGKSKTNASPLACSTAIKRIPSMRFQSVAASPVPCGDSFFEDTDNFTQSHISYMQESHLSVHSSPAEAVSTGASKSSRTSLDSVAPLSGFQCSQLRKGAASSSQVSECSAVVISDDSASTLTKMYADTSSSLRFDYNICTATRDHKAKQDKGLGVRNTKFLPCSDNASSENIVDDFEDGDSNDFHMADVEEWDTQACETRAGALKSPSVISINSETDAYIPVFGSTDKDDGGTGEFDGESFPHSKELRSMFHTVFGLREFRHNQLQAINAALLGHDCFILMPTGGGKSLCYQLPTLVSRGISVVVSPLRALIQDQVQRLIAFDIPAAHLSGEMETGQANSVYSQLYQREPGVKLLYVTPEKLSASEKLLNSLESLFRRQLLDRFVIDEAHCVSQWGHDFRPDYKKLNVLRTKFPGVPVMALTATATPRVRSDIIHQLAMKEPKWFMQSFNRPNLKYSVKPKKPSNATADVIEMIKSEFKRDCGIIYCLSRKECDTVAEQLKKVGIEAESYHAGLSDSERSRIQDRWLNGDKCQVICATIAFGMGIDKADVRFVIHYSVPKSVEGYYQEAGRAGRDGMLAHCILLYTYSDVKRLRRIIELDQCATYESKKVHINNLFRMVHYCENMADCRRAQILHYFGEHHFDRDRCNMVAGALCDNCKSKDMFVVRNVTEDAKEVVKCVRELTSNRRSDYTLLHIVEIFKGSQNTRIVDLGHNKLALHGRGTAYSRSDAERLMHRLVIEGILAEELRTTAADTTACYAMLGSKAADLMQDKIQIQMAVQGGRKHSKQCLIGQEPQTSRQQLIEECYKELLVLAKTIATEHGSKNYALIFPNAMLWQLAEKTPLTVEEMKKEIDGLPETKINKYGAHRFLDVTTKFCVMLSTLPDDGMQDEDVEPVKTDDWASPYFSASSTRNSATARRGFGRGKRGRSRSKKKNPHGVKKIRTSGAGRGKGQQPHPSFISGSNARPSAKLGPSRGTGVIKSTLGMMPDPRARSYLASIGSYMG